MISDVVFWRSELSNRIPRMQFPPICRQVASSRFMASFRVDMASSVNMVISPSMLQLFIFWELVGLASYLLIGFYYEKWSAS